MGVVKKETTEHIIFFKSSREDNNFDGSISGSAVVA